tara:strand:+ start:1056 stop:1265 length:210 start_codon:yes stop_codon:yes gene_type:complete
MIKTNMKAVVSNRGNMEVGIVKKRWKRKGIIYFNVYLERGYLMENLTEDTEKQCHILYDLSIKINKATK